MPLPNIIIDAHQHFWRLSRDDYGWLTPDLGEPLYRDYLPTDLAPHLRKAGVSHTVVVQAAPTEAETRFLLALAEENAFVAGVVGWLDLEDDAFETRLDGLLKHPKFVGLRPMLQDLDDDAYILRPKVIGSLHAIAERGTAFDFLTHPKHLGNVAKALDAVPTLRAVIDHISKPNIAAGSLAGWAGDMAHVATFPNVYCKLSGMITEARHDAWRPHDLRPYVEHVLKVFGAERLMFGSDWPVCLLAGSYAEVLNALRTVLDAELDQAGQGAVYGLNAARFYRLSIP
jgi:L-fuconolactonase